MALYKTLYTLSHCVLSCATDCFTVCMRFVNVLTINGYYIIIGFIFVLTTAVDTAELTLLWRILQWNVANGEDR